MKKEIKQNRGCKTKEKIKKVNAQKRSREVLENKVEEGVRKAIKEYRDVFEKLAEYDRT